jgi:hypothetical protein
MKALPFPKRFRGNGLILIGIPGQHSGVEILTHAFAVPLNYTVRIVKQVICINDTYFSFLGNSTELHFVWVRRAVAATVHMAWYHKLNFVQIIEHTPEFIVPGLGLVELVKPSDVAKWWNRAAIVGGNAIMWVPDQKGEMELGKELGWDDSRITGFGMDSIRIWRRMGPRTCVFGNLIGGAVAIAGFKAEVSVNLLQGWSDTGRHAIWWDKIMDNVLNKKALPLVHVSMPQAVGGCEDVLA